MLARGKEEEETTIAALMMEQGRKVSSLPKRSSPMTSSLESD
jgi:hypothetical protein